MHEEAPGKFRHVVPSPEPMHIVDVSLVQTVAESGAIVIACGGGGVPVVRDPDGTRRGLEAVIDKDLATAHMANILDCEVLLILTEARGVALDFGTPQERWLEEVPASELRDYQKDGYFPEGNMGPKVEAALRFVERGGRRAIIAQLFDVMPALRGESGTHVVPG